MRVCSTVGQPATSQLLPTHEFNTNTALPVQAAMSAQGQMQSAPPVACS